MAAGLNAGSNGGLAGADPPGTVLPPGPTTPGAIQSLQWMYRPIQFMRRCRDRYGPNFTIRLGSAHGIVVIGDPDHAMDVLGGPPDVFDSGKANLLFGPVLGRNSLLLLDAPEHMHQRKIMLPTFGAGHVPHYAGLIERAVRKRIAQWPVDEPFSLDHEMEAITYEAITGVAFGEGNDDEIQKMRELIPEMMDRCDSIFTLLPPLRVELMGLSPYARLKRVVREIDELMFSIIEERRADPLSQLRQDVLSILLAGTHEDGSPLTDRDIRDQLLTLVMAGYETTSAGLLWAFERIVREPRVHRRLVSEIDAGEEKYLEATVKETLRARPAVPIVARKVRVPVTIGSYRVPAGTVLMASVYLVHNDPDVYPDPEVFRPERFLDGIKNKRAWIPFGGGVRRCLGASFAQLEMKITLRTVFSELELEAVDRDPEAAVRKRFTFVPRDSTRVRSRPRSHAATPAGPAAQPHEPVTEPEKRLAGELKR